MTKNNEKAQAAFIAKIAEITARIDELKDYAENHMDFSPDEITWAHVGSAEHLLAALTELTDQAYRRGEYAED